MAEGKYFFIRSQMSGQVLDVYGNTCQPDQPVYVYETKDEGIDNQLWFIHPLTRTIRSKKDPEYCMDLNGDNELVVNPYSDKDSQKWKLSGDRVQRHSDPEQVLDIKEGRTEPGSTVMMYNYHGGDNQLWDIECQEPQFFYIRSAMHGMVMDISEDNPDEGAVVVMFTQKEHPSDNQLWYEDRYGYIRSKLNNMVLDGSGNEFTMQTHDTGSDRQRWAFDGDKITNVDRPEEVIDISGRNEDKGATLCAYNYHGNDNQQWSRDYI